MTGNHHRPSMPSEMGKILTDSNFDGAVLPFAGALTGEMAGVAFMIAVEGVGQEPVRPDPRIAALHNQVSGLKQAQEVLPANSPPAITHNLSAQIQQKRGEVKQVVADQPHGNHDIAAVIGPLAVGPVLFMVLGAAISAKLRINRASRAGEAAAAA